MDKTKLYFKNLDSIRFFAAFIVFVEHAVSPAYKYLPIQGTYFMKILNVFSDGGIGVSIFFVLSGFLITYLLLCEYELNSKISLKNFYMRRILRIWPLYFFVVLFSFFIYPLLKNFGGMNNSLSSSVMYYFTFLSNFDVIHVHKYFTGNDALSQNITWSVSVEEQFYLFWPLLFVFLPKKHWKFSIFSVIICSLLFRIYHFNDTIVLYYHTFSVLIDLGLGAIMASLIKSNQKIKLFFENISTRTHILLFSFSFGMILWGNRLFDFDFGPAIVRFFISFSFALIISAQAFTTKLSILNLGRLSFPSTWGKYTYGIYLLHPIIITFWDVVYRVIGIPKTGFISLFSIAIFSFVLTLVISKFSFLYFESKFLALKERFTS